ncbi:F-box/kelch-repeat protein At2g43270-like [Silene latifolia]|uniref:F-box/kelch-repeat protein At2g43270-like n=1 Tax=Silene latifolia TaxID=37657 RepID=UPI003D78107E
MEFQSKDEKRPIQKSELLFDVINEMILTRLPIKSVVRFKYVSKLWYSTLSSPRFAYAHLKMFNPSTTQSLFIQYVFENKFKILSYEDGDQSSQMDNKCEIDWVNEKVDFDIGKEYVYLVGSCNGLVCLGSTSGCLFIIWNPITHEFFKYRDSEISKVARRGLLVTWGFGYVSSVDDYKVVRLCRDGRCDFMRVYVYSTRFGKLKIIDNNDDSHNFSGLRKTNNLVNPGVLVNETLYWMDNAPKIPSLMNGLPREILSFDLATEMFGTFPHLEVSTPLRNARDKDAFSDELLCEVNGCLSKYEKSMKTESGFFVVIVVYVDDLLVTENDPIEIQNIKTLLHQAFINKDLGQLRYFLGIEVAR